MVDGIRFLEEFGAHSLISFRIPVAVWTLVSTGPKRIEAMNQSVRAPGICPSRKAVSPLAGLLL